MSISNFIDKTEEFSSQPQIEQVKLMAYFYISVNNLSQFSTRDINTCFVEENLKVPTNISHLLALLRKSKPPILVQKSKTFSFHRDAQSKLDSIYQTTQHKKVVALLLIDHIRKVKGREQQVFLDEAIKCYEVQCFRAGIIMTWLLTMDVLYENILNKNLVAFNAAMQAHTKFKKFNPISEKEDFSDIKEVDFIELLRGAGIISNDIRKILVKRLDDRNTVAHPNTITITEANANHFIEDLLINVVEKFQV